MTEAKTLLASQGYHAEEIGVRLKKLADELRRRHQAHDQDEAGCRDVDRYGGRSVAGEPPSLARAKALLRHFGYDPQAIGRRLKAVADRLAVQREHDAAPESDAERDVGIGAARRSRHEATGREVIVQWFRRDCSASEREELMRGRDRCARLVHPNIVPLIDAGETDGRLWTAFAFVPGETLRAVLDRDGALDANHAIHLCGQVLDALAYAHAQGILHGNLRPDTVLVTTAGPRRHALVQDFGLATVLGEARGSSTYAAPELRRGGQPTAQSDLYAWGLVLLECLTGPGVVRSRSDVDSLIWGLGEAPVTLTSFLASRRLGALLRRVTARSTDRRAASAVEVLGELAALAPTSRSVARGADVLSVRTEKRQLTMISCRLEATNRDVAAAHAASMDLALQEQHAALAEIAAGYGGVRVSTLAGRALFVFGYPDVRENEARLAVRAALEMVAEVEHGKRRLAARIGVHTGLGWVRDGGDVADACESLGSSPDAAVRLDALAAANEVLVSSDTHRLLRGIVASEARGEHDLGALGHVPVFRVVPVGMGGDVPTVRIPPESRLVGRAAELEALVGGWKSAQCGRSGLALITGESGIGKTRLVRELSRRVPVTSWIETRCVPEHYGSPLRPIADMLAGMIGGRPIGTIAARYGLDPVHAEPVLAELLGLPADVRGALPPATPDRRRELVLDVLARLLVGVGKERVVVLVVEDLHWSDPATLELLARILVRAHEIASDTPHATPRLYLVCTARPPFEWSAAFAPTVSLQLKPLAPRDVTEMFGAVGDAADLPAGVLPAVISRSAGIPLFVEEIARVLVEDDSADRRFVIPDTLGDVLRARLDHLSRGARETVQLAAALGGEFGWDDLRAIAAPADGVLREDLRELTDAGFVFKRTRIRAERYVFKHALVREAAYETMSMPVRADVHDRVATALEQMFPDVALDRPELLAHHSERAGRIVLAVEQWKRSGDRTMARGAYVEAINHFQRALELIEGERAPMRASLVPLELGVLESLGTAQLSTQGYASAEVEATFVRAQGLCDRLGEDVPVRVLHGIWGVHIARGDRDAVRRMLPRFHRMAEGSSDAVSQLTAHAHVGLAAFLEGDFSTALTALQAAVPWYHSDGYRAFLREYGYDGGLYAYAYLSWATWITGDAALARRLRAEMLETAMRSQNPYGMAIALGFAANVAHELGDLVDAREFSRRAIDHATEHRLYLWLGPATCMHGWAMVADGERDAGFAMLQHGFGLFRLVGLRTTYPFHLALLAEAHLACGDVEAGLVAVDEALSMTAEFVDRFYEAELHRLRGELLIAGGRIGEGRAEVTDAFELATRQGARAFALRAALVLARLRHAEGAPAEARALLEAACAPMATEGSSAHEIEARAALKRWPSH